MKTQSKKVRFMSLLAVALVLSLSGCGKEETNQTVGNGSEPTEDPSIVLDADSVVFVDLPIYKCLKQIAQPHELVIINSQEEFDATYPECAIPLDFDFSKVSLLSVHGSCAGILDKQVTIDRENGDNITITITITENNFIQGFWSWSLSFLCAKIYDDQNVQLIVNYIYP